MATRPFRKSTSIGGFGRVLLSSTALTLGVSAVAACSSNGDTDAAGTVTPSGCETDCSANAAAPICDPTTGKCVQCLPENDTCPEGQYCDDASKSCVEKCLDDEDCTDPLVCNTSLGKCAACNTSSQCEPGMICGSEGDCVPGCTDSQPCPDGSECCEGVCANLEVDALHCGACGEACDPLPNATVSCVARQCVLETCDEGFADCNLNSADGCEWDVAANGPCTCTPGETKSCYTGPAGTEGVGACAGGTTTCNEAGTGWGPCLGETLPSFDTCDDGIDNDCDGDADNPPDQDGDGWTVCEGDCCDSIADGCDEPHLVNPGAFDVLGNDVDDDCSGEADELDVCDTALASDSSAPFDYAKALGLCAAAVENPATPQEKKWGVISATFSTADGTGSPHAEGKSIRTAFGSNVLPQEGSSLVVLATGAAAAQAQTNPDWVAFQPGLNSGINSGVPADWLAANRGQVPNPPDCPPPIAGATAFDPVMLKLRVRVPTNANSFSVSMFFYSSEYPESVCTAYNDFFVTLLDSSFTPGPGPGVNPADKNIAVFRNLGGDYHPVGVNHGFGNSGLFDQCKNGNTGCFSPSTPGENMTCTDTSQLLGTGFDVSDPNRCNSDSLIGGGTGWLTMSGNVTPGETIELRFAIWDTSDGGNDSLVLLDDFKWSVATTTPGAVRP